MKKLIIIVIAFFAISQITAQKKYKQSWESIDSRPIPNWFTDAKFGIFIHWGPYAVPAYAKVGDYSEWYWYNLVKGQNSEHGGNATSKFHKQIYGDKFAYPDFVPMFTCQMFDANQWAGVFKKSGAKYVVLTAKHHDGYCLWPSVEADNSWGRPWNSVNSGPGRDLLGELAESVREKALKMGIYYSLYEWYNPLYTNDIDLYVDKHLIPQFKDVVQRYSPSIIFSDGEWKHTDKTWRSTELLSWLYNESPCKDEVVINDRWGKDLRHKHGGYFTTEYGAGLPDAKNSWEENRGMGHSFGYNRNENFEDYNSTQALIYMLIDIVSRGGNFLLDIGPTADGRIPVIMQERLIEMGDWLNVNGEAIYGTECWENTCQWTKGEIPQYSEKRDQAEYDIMKLTLSSDEGVASKQLWFTQKDNDLFCICPVYPKNKLVVKGVTLKSDAKVELLGLKEKLKWKQNGNNIEIEVPCLTASEVPCQFAWAFKLSGLR